MTPFIGRSFPYFTTDELADLLNEQAGHNAWDARRVKRWLRRSGAGLKRGGRWVTTRDLLREHMPELWAELWMRLAETPREAA